MHGVVPSPLKCLLVREQLQCARYAVHSQEGACWKKRVVGTSHSSRNDGHADESNSFADILAWHRDILPCAF
jgi:hypothetical protein